MDNTFNAQFDEELLKAIPHLNFYPEMKPFIGEKWGQRKVRVLFLAESHFFPGEKSTLPIPKDDWYNKRWEGIGNNRGFIQTREVIQKAKNDKEHDKHLRMYFNIRRSLRNVNESLRSEEVFQFFSFYNYFQRPCFKIGGSIDNSQLDDEVAFNTLKSVVEIIKPNAIFFFSIKAYKAFKIYENKKSQQDNVFSEMKIVGLPHASSPWWNRKNKSYGDKSGKSKFEDHLKDIFRDGF